MALLLPIFIFVPNIQWAVLCCGTGQRGNLRETPSSSRTTHFQDTWVAVVLKCAWQLFWRPVTAQRIICGGVLSSTKAGEDLLDYLKGHLKSCQFVLQKFANITSPHFPWKDVEEYWSCFDDLFENCLLLSSWHWTTCRHREAASFTDFYTQELQLAIETSKNKQKPSFPFCVFSGTRRAPKSRLLMTLQCNKYSV